MKTRIKKRTPKTEARRVSRSLDKRQTSVGRGESGSKSGKSNPVRDLRQRFGISRKAFSRVVGFSERAIADWESSKAPSDACVLRIREMARLQKALAGVMRPQFIGAWLESPNEAFGGLKPVEVIERGELDRIWRMIYQLESGVPT